MGVRGSALSRAIRFFKEGDIDEAEYVLQRGAEIVAGRKGPRPAKKSARKPRSTRRTNAAESATQSAEAN